MAKYQKYAEYKDSGVEWLGVVPSIWKIGALRWKISIASGEGISTLEISKEQESSSPIPIIGGNGIMGFSNKTNSSHAIAIGRVGALCGNVHLINFDSWISDNALKISKWIDFNDCFLVYLLKSARLNDLASKTAQPLITGEQIKSLLVVIPSIEEQTQIANFLDHETAKIDSLIAKQEKLIELLKEKRQAVISHAVTKGLNPDVTMKDSGVEWLGQVPEHWVIGRLKNVLSIKNGRDYKTVEVEIGGYPVYGSGGIFKRSSAYLYDGVSILFGRKGTVDKPLLVEGRFWTVDTMFYSELDAGTDPEYIYFQSLGFPFDMLSTNTALPSMTQEDLLNLGFVIPPYNEQKAISEYIQDYLKKSNSLMKKAESAIQLMQERRTALISSAVTGKIDLRNWQNPNNNNEKQGL